MIYVVLATKVMILKTPFQNIKYIILTPYMEVLDGNSFSNYRMGKILFTQNSFENTCVDMECRDVGVEVEKRRMIVLIKCTLCLCTYVDQPIPCATTFTHIWERA